MIITKKDLKKDFVKKIKREKKLLEHSQLFNQRKTIKTKRYGVYFLFRESVLVYIGKTTRGEYRIWEHVSANEKKFDSFTFIRCWKNELDALEELYIKKYKPEYNISLNNKKFKTKQSRKEKKKQYGYRSVYHNKEVSVEQSQTI